MSSSAARISAKILRTSPHPRGLQQRVHHCIAELSRCRVIEVFAEVTFLHEAQLFQHAARGGVIRRGLRFDAVQPYACTR